MKIVLDEKDKIAAKMIIEKAKKGETIYYSEIMNEIKASRGKDIGKRLAKIGHACQERGLPILASLVVLKSTGRVHDGYSEFAPNFQEDYSIVEREQQKVWANKDWKDLDDCNLSEEKSGEKQVNEKDKPDDDITSAIEGFYRETTTRVKSRSRKLREQCLKLNGRVCAVCGFDPVKFYGERFANLIQVHHVNPMANSGERVTTVEDLVPLCPNCHIAIHLKGNGELYEVEELKEIVEEHKKNN